MSVADENEKWFHSILHSFPCKIIEEQTLWGQAVCRVWLPNEEDAQ
ncbi:MAG: hypothetical protein LBQ90_02785 [Synergistaceae bacterium]|jgi:hypothetical protein|nr:hypothetical protein [Synergistaceae bacterium]